MTDHLFSSTPRGIRNNNWLNIKYNSRNHWKGQVGSDGVFCIFSDPVFCIRAAHLLLKKYLKRNPDMTLRDFIYIWSSTDQEAYLLFVVKFSPVSSHLLPCTRLDSLYLIDKVVLFRLMAIFENGNSYKSVFDDYTIIRGLCLK